MSRKLEPGCCICYTDEKPVGCREEAPPPHHLSEAQNRIYAGDHRRFCGAVAVSGILGHRCPVWDQGCLAGEGCCSVSSAGRCASGAAGSACAPAGFGRVAKQDHAGGSVPGICEWLIKKRLRTPFGGMTGAVCVSKGVNAGSMMPFADAAGFSPRAVPARERSAFCGRRPWAGTRGDP